MNFYIFIKQAFSSIQANKLRSFLSTLGIIIGISSFVIMLALGEGAKASITKEFSGSADIISVQSLYNNDSFANDIVTREISELIKQKVPGVKNSFTYSNTYPNIVYNDKRLGASVFGIEKGYLHSKNADLIYGNYFSLDNHEKSDKVIIIGNKLVKNNFKDTNPIGKYITISGEQFLIIGILKEKNWEFDSNIYMPMNTIKNILNITKINKIEVIVKNQNQITEVKNYLNYFLWKKSNVTDQKQVKFQTRTNKDELKMVTNIINKLSLLLAGIGAIALIVGGIGIMNIMLVSVTERTREIGIRKAIGATNSNILLQFLIESVILTLIGSILALLLSNGVVKLIGMISEEFQPVINLNVILIATGVAISMGIIFGLMPAYKAAKLKVIDALSFE